MSKKTKKVKRSHPWRVWIPKKDRPAEEVSKYEKIPNRNRMGVRL